MTITSNSPSLTPKQLAALMQQLAAEHATQPDSEENDSDQTVIPYALPLPGKSPAPPAAA